MQYKSDQHQHQHQHRHKADGVLLAMQWCMYGVATYTDSDSTDTEMLVKYYQVSHK